MLVRFYIVISTHAPAGGATQLFQASPEFFVHFYSRPCGRGDSEPNYHIGDILTFLLTPLREGRRFQS